MPRLNKITDEEKRLLRIGAILIGLAVLLVILVVRNDLFGSVFNSIRNAMTPFVVGLVIAYILNVFVSFF